MVMADIGERISERADNSRRVTEAYLFIRGDECRRENRNLEYKIKHITDTFFRTAYFWNLSLSRLMKIRVTLQSNAHRIYDASWYTGFLTKTQGEHVPSLIPRPNFQGRTTTVKKEAHRKAFYLGVPKTVEGNVRNCESFQNFDNRQNLAEKIFPETLEKSMFPTFLILPY